MMESKNIKTYPIFAINRHRILRDGDGITTLVGFGYVWGFVGYWPTNRVY